MKRLLSLHTILLFGAPLGHCISPADVPADTPVSSLLASAKSSLAGGNSNDALIYYDVAISRDPQNYLTVFQRGATYLSLGKNSLANADFDKALQIKPDFEGALLQRAKLKGRNADWISAREDYKSAGKEGSPEFQELVEAEEAANRAAAAEQAKDWEACVTQAGTAIVIAGTNLPLRQRRARCRFEKGEVQEGVSDLNHVLQLSPESLEPHLQISSMLFYSVGDTEKGLAAIKKCLHSDPESKPCKKLHRQEKKIDKALNKVKQLQSKKQYTSAARLLVGDGEDIGLITQVKEDVKEAKSAGSIHQSSPNDLYGMLIEMACEAYVESNSRKKAEPYCAETLEFDPNSLPALLFKARRQLDNEEFESVIHTLNHAKEHHPGANQIQSLLQKAHTLLKRSKTKDYYKVLGVASDADDRTIKRSYRNLIKKFHPDKAAAQGMSKEESEKKMASINEAYEVLSDPEKRAQFDRGDDPNSHEHQGNPFHGSPFGSGGQQFFFQSGGGGQRSFHFQQQGGMPFNFPGGFPFGG